MLLKSLKFRFQYIQIYVLQILINHKRPSKSKTIAKNLRSVTRCPTEPNRLSASAPHKTVKAVLPKPI